MMNRNLKNIALISSIIFVPLKSGNVTKRCSNTFCHSNKNIVKTSAFADNLWKQDNKAREFFTEPLLLIKEMAAKSKIGLPKVPKPSKSMDVTKTKYEGSPEYLNIFLGGVLKGKGKNFIEAQNKYGINATFLIGIANHESARGTSDFAKNKNNIAGMRGKNGYLNFESVDECIDKMAANLKKRYIDDGLTTIEQIHKRYAECSEWSSRIVSHINPIYKNTNNLIYKY